MALVTVATSALIPPSLVEAKQAPSVLSTARLLGARSFVNGNVGADKIYVANNVAATLRGGSEDDTITVIAGGADGTQFYGDKGNDTITDLAGDSKLYSGDGNDTLIGGEGADVLTGGLGADLFSVADTHNAANAIELTEIKDFTVAQTDKLGAFGITDIQQDANITDLISAGDATSIAASEAITLTTLSGATTMTNTSGNVLVASSTTAFTVATLSDALETGGDLAITFNNALAANDAFLVVYDNNVDTFIAQVVTGAIIADNAEAAAADLTITNLVELDGFNDATGVTRCPNDRLSLLDTFWFQLYTLRKEGYFFA